MRKVLTTCAIGPEHYLETYRKHASRFEQYAKHWGFDFEPHFKLYDLGKHVNGLAPYFVTWNKIRIILDYLLKLRQGDLISWIDADVCIVRGDLELTTNKSIGMCVDYSGNKNAGVMTVKVNQFTRAFFTKMFDRTDCDWHCWQDNLALIKQLDELPKDIHDVNIEYLDRTMNCTVKYKEFISDDQVRFRHFAGEIEKLDKDGKLAKFDQDLLDKDMIF